MKIRKMWLVVALLLCVAFISVALPTTVAYVAGRSNTVHNTFRVEYLPARDVVVPVTVHKTVQCAGSDTIGPEGFSFRLQNLATGTATAMVSSSEGWASTQLTFTAADAGKTYRYQLYEANGGRDKVTYDNTVYDITITLELNEYHEMFAVIKVNDEVVPAIKAEFVNLYGATDVPDTGDDNQPLLWLAVMLCSGAGLLLLCRKDRMLRRKA